MRMLITCSDARIRPEQIANFQKEQIFVLRNAGNIVPHAQDPASGSEAATIDLAVESLGVKEIILCGHTDCGAMKTLVDHPQSPASKLPSMHYWLQHAKRTKELVNKLYQDHSPDERLAAAVEANVHVQVEHLKSYPNVARKLATGELRISPLVYEIETGITRTC